MMVVIIVMLLYVCGALSLSSSVGAGYWYSTRTTPKKTTSAIDTTCTVSAWGACDPTTRTQSRSVLTPATGGGVCPTLTQSCVPDVNCVVGEWGACDPVMKTRMRGITTQPSGKGTACSVLTEACTPNTNCAVGEWGTCDALTKMQSRLVTTPQSGTGTACPVVMQACVPNTDCVVSDWSGCQPDRTQLRTVTLAPSGTGKACPLLMQACSYSKPPDQFRLVDPNFSVSRLIALTLPHVYQSRTQDLTFSDNTMLWYYTTEGCIKNVERGGFLTGDMSVVLAETTSTRWTWNSERKTFTNNESKLVLTSEDVSRMTNFTVPSSVTNSSWLCMGVNNRAQQGTVDINWDHKSGAAGWACTQWRPECKAEGCYAIRPILSSTFKIVNFGSDTFAYVQSTGQLKNVTTSKMLDKDYVQVTGNTADVNQTSWIVFGPTRLTNVISGKHVDTYNGEVIKTLF